MGNTSAEVTPHIEATLSTGDLHELARTPFHKVPASLQRRAYGMPYAQLQDARGDKLWVTPHGWLLLQHLEPARWYADRQYDRHGEKMPKGSGAVFRVASAASERKVDLVVKFSRMAQDLPVHVSSRFPSGVPRHVLDESVFNDPFQEFGLLEQLRTSTFGPSDLRILTKRPLAIYSPARRFNPWQLGRTEDRFRPHQRQLARDQDRLRAGLTPIQISIDRQYITLFHWVRGLDAEALVERGALSADDASRLVVTVTSDLAAKGFRVLDTKPNHMILRQRPDGRLLRRADRLVYALVDFELLQPTEEFQRSRDPDSAR